MWTDMINFVSKIEQLSGASRGVVLFRPKSVTADYLTFKFIISDKSTEIDSDI